LSLIPRQEQRHKFVIVQKSHDIVFQGAALGSMVGKLSYGKRQWEHLDAPMRRIIPDLDKTFRMITDMVDADTSAFNDYLAAMKLPKTSEEEIAKREEAMDEGLKKAISVPYNLAKTINKIWGVLVELAAIGNLNCKSDLQAI
jgi:Methenyl tetrahydrofolate cyclohydrolase